MARVELRTVKGKFQTMFCGPLSQAKREHKRLKRQCPRLQFILVLEI